MLEESVGNITGLDLRPNDRRIDDAASVSIIIVKRNDQQTVAAGLKKRLAQQRTEHVGLQPLVSNLRSAVMGVMVVIRNNDGVLRKLIGGQVRSELRERDHLVLLSHAID